MEIYVAFFAGSLSVVLLAVVYLADRWEPEPVELPARSGLPEAELRAILSDNAAEFFGRTL